MVPLGIVPLGIVPFGVVPLGISGGVPLGVVPFGISGGVVPLSELLLSDKTVAVFKLLDTAESDIVAESVVAVPFVSAESVLHGGSGPARAAL